MKTVINKLIRALTPKQRQRQRQRQRISEGVVILGLLLVLGTLIVIGTTYNNNVADQTDTRTPKQSTTQVGIDTNAKRGAKGGAKGGTKNKGVAPNGIQPNVVQPNISAQPNQAAPQVGTNIVGGAAGFEDCLGVFPKGNAPYVLNSQVAQNLRLRPLCFTNYAILYSGTTKKPVIAIERLRYGVPLTKGGERTEDFHAEIDRLPLSEQSTLESYRGSGYDRGHNVPAGDVPDNDPNNRMMSETFSLANMMPQDQTLNRGVWAKSVEAATRKFAERNRGPGDVFVFTGSSGQLGLIGSGQHSVVVPAYVWKLVYDETGNRAWAYWLENNANARVTGANIITVEQLIQNIKAVDGIDIAFNI